MLLYEYILAEIYQEKQAVWRNYSAMRLRRASFSAGHPVDVCSAPTRGNSSAMLNCYDARNYLIIIIDNFRKI